MKTAFYDTTETAEVRHPADIIEPAQVDANLKMTAEAYNKITHWILSAGSVEKIGLRALCIYTCAQRRAVPRDGLFRTLETPEAASMGRKMLCTIMAWVIRAKTPVAIGRRAIAAFTAIRQEVTGEKNLSAIGQKAGCKKQAISKNQMAYRRAMNLRTCRKTAA
jgi:hypothetical protein